MAKKLDQASHRRSTRVRDQHDREWGVTIDVNTMAPVGTPMWVGWNPVRLPNGRVLMPPQKHMLFNPEDLGRVTIDYTAWKAELEAAAEGWETQLASLAQGMYGDKAAEALDSPPAALLRLIGPHPFPVELVEACERGDPWALGLASGTDKRTGRVLFDHPMPKALEAVLTRLAPRRRTAAASQPAAS